MFMLFRLYYLVLRFQFMGADGVLLTRFITAKAGSLACRDVVQRVWTKYARERGAARTTESDDEWSVPYSETCYAGSYHLEGCSTCASLSTMVMPH